MHRCLKIVQSAVRTNIEETQKKMKLLYEQIHRPLSFQVGELALLKNNTHRKGESSKLRPKMIGP